VIYIRSNQTEITTTKSRGHLRKNEEENSKQNLNKYALDSKINSDPGHYSLSLLSSQAQSFAYASLRGAAAVWQQKPAGGAVDESRLL
jgi:hypothetical protein